MFWYTTNWMHHHYKSFVPSSLTIYCVRIRSCIDFSSVLNVDYKRFRIHINVVLHTFHYKCNGIWNRIWRVLHSFYYLVKLNFFCIFLGGKSSGNLHAKRIHDCICCRWHWFVGWSWSNSELPQKGRNTTTSSSDIGCQQNGSSQIKSYLYWQ